MNGKKLSLEESKKIMFDILKSVDACCRKNGLNYSLDWGTLLGAVRHNGFIPWDDDIDLMMPRKDFDRFSEVFSHNKYKILDKNNPNWGWHYIRVYDSDTLVDFGPDAEKISKHGLWLSIFPVDGVPDNHYLWNKHKRKIEFYHGLCRLKRSGWTHGEFFIRNFIKALARVVLSPISLQFFAKKEDNLYRKYSECKTDYLFQRCDQFQVMPSALFDRYIDVLFEKEYFKCIAEYDKYLRLTYGDYMQLPPIDKRSPKHGYTAYLLK